MKKYIYLPLTIAVLITLFASVTYTSCKKDKCKKVTCANGGTCYDGNCACASGYTGKTCETLARDIFAKSYKGDGTDTDGDNYTGNTLVFSAGADNATMKLRLLDGSGGEANSFEVKLGSNNTYTLVTKTEFSQTYNGTGTLSETEASLKLVITGSRTLEVNFPRMIAQ